MTTAPVILYCSGIPVVPGSLDFGTVVSQAETNALSTFSQLVNAIPSTSGNIWSQTDSETWSVYEQVLSLSEFGETQVSPNPAAPPSAVIVETLRKSLFPMLTEIGFELGEVPAETIAPPASPPAEEPVQSQSTLAAAFQQLSADFALHGKLDTLGDQYYATYVYPPDFDSSANELLWTPFNLTPGRNDPWLAINEGSTVSGELIVLPVHRPWFTPWIFSSRGWRFTEESGLGLLSDGGSPPQGLLPVYVTGLMIARNLKVVNVNIGLMPPVSVHLTLSGSAPPVSEGGMSIIGFCCEPLPLSPNPDLSLQW